MKAKTDSLGSGEPVCPICSNIRGLAEHLTELGQAAELLGNESAYNSEHGAVTIRTETIGEWLQLAARLESVEVNAWKYGGQDAFYCGTIADSIDAHSRHYTAHATALTRFMFVCNGLEEAYRFIDHLYMPLADKIGIAQPLRKRTSSLRATAILDDLFNRQGSNAEPNGFEHLAGNFVALFKQYTRRHKSTPNGMEGSAEIKKSYALHLLRNLRNHVAHGTFPLGPPADYGGYEDSEELAHLLNYGCRTAALYMQIMLHEFSRGFEGYDYKAIQNANGPEFDNFVERCNLEYVKNLHLKGDFALHKGLYPNE